MKRVCCYSALTTVTLAVSYRLLERTSLPNIGHVCVWIQRLARSSGARSEPKHHLLVRYSEFCSVGQQIMSITAVLASRHETRKPLKVCKANLWHVRVTIPTVMVTKTILTFVCNRECM